MVDSTINREAIFILLHQHRLSQVEGVYGRYRTQDSRQKEERISFISHLVEAGQSVGGHGDEIRSVCGGHINRWLSYHSQPRSNINSVTKSGKTNPTEWSCSTN